MEWAQKQNLLKDLLRSFRYNGHEDETAPENNLCSKGYIIIRSWNSQIETFRNVN